VVEVRDADVRGLNSRNASGTKKVAALHYTRRRDRPPQAQSRVNSAAIPFTVAQSRTLQELMGFQAEIAKS
jgi:hypothetical protein